MWFHIFNQGYRMPAISELDAGLGVDDRFYYGSMPTYFQVNGDFTVQNVAESVRRGETFVTSGPILKVNIDEKYKIGEIVRLDNKKHKLNIARYSGRRASLVCGQGLWQKGLGESGHLQGK